MEHNPEAIFLEEGTDDYLIDQLCLDRQPNPTTYFNRVLTLAQVIWGDYENDPTGQAYEVRILAETQTKDVFEINVAIDLPRDIAEMTAESMGERFDLEVIETCLYDMIY